MRTYKQMYRRLLSDTQKNTRYEVLYMNACEELRKLRQIVDAIYKQDAAELSFHLVDYQQMFRRPTTKRTGGTEE